MIEYITGRLTLFVTSLFRGLLPVDSAPIRANRVFPNRRLIVAWAVQYRYEVDTTAAHRRNTHTVDAGTLIELRCLAAVSSSTVPLPYRGVDGMTTAAHTRTRRHGSSGTNRTTASRPGWRLTAESTLTSGPSCGPSTPGPANSRRRAASAVANTVSASVVAVASPKRACRSPEKGNVKT